MNLEKETRFIMNKYNITANKNYGQNFLIDETAVEEIVNKSEVNKNDLVIEIGPGLGNLTKYLLEAAGKVICIELDTNVLKILNDRFSLFNNFELINDDVLKVDLKQLIANNSEFQSVKVVANLPYYITTPIIMKLLEEHLNLTSITVMVQKEVALRLTETPGGKETGAITYSINYYTNPSIVLDVSKECFIPSPKVDSAVIKLDVLSKPKVKIKNEELFFKIIKASFLQKRKTLVNSLSNNGIADKDFLEKMLSELGLDVRIRAEKLTLDDFSKITEYIEKNKVS